MKVQQLMKRNVATCRPADSLEAAARTMWERDCGCVPVVADDGTEHVIGMLTDRDICMAAWTQGRPLRELTVQGAMSSGVASCRPMDSIPEALSILRAAQVHRLPVLDAGGALMGLLSLADVAREAEREHGARKAEVRGTDVAATVEAISRPRTVALQVA